MVVNEPGGEMERIRQGLLQVKDVASVINPLNASEMKELTETICNPQQMEIPNLVKKYIAVKNFGHLCLE